MTGPAFKVGEKYDVWSHYNHFFYGVMTVVGRTAKSIRVSGLWDEGVVKTRRVCLDGAGVERIVPLGKDTKVGAEHIHNEQRERELRDHSTYL